MHESKEYRPDPKWQLYQIEQQLKYIENRLEHLENHLNGQDSRLTTAILASWIGIVYLVIILTATLK